jgi:hypothetical protein
LAKKKKEYDSAIAVHENAISAELDGGKLVNGKSELTAQELHDEAWRRESLRYQNMMKNTSGGQAAPGQAPPAAGQPMTPPATAQPAAPAAVAKPVVPPNAVQPVVSTNLYLVFSMIFLYFLIHNFF